MKLELHRHNKTTFQLFYDKFLCRSFSTQVGLNSAKDISIEHFPDAKSAIFWAKIQESSATLVTVWVKFHPKCHLQVSKRHQTVTKLHPQVTVWKVCLILILLYFDLENIKVSPLGATLVPFWWHFGDTFKFSGWHFGWNFTQTVTKVALDVLIFLGFLTKKWLMLHLESVQYWYFLQNLIQPGRWNSDKETCHRTIEKLFYCVCGALDS